MPLGAFTPVSGALTQGTRYGVGARWERGPLARIRAARRASPGMRASGLSGKHVLAPQHPLSTPGRLAGWESIGETCRARLPDSPAPRSTG